MISQLAAGQLVPGRYAHCAVTFGSHMIVYGGRGFEEGKNSLRTLGDAWAFGYEDDVWRELYSYGSSTPGPSPRSGHT